MIIGASQIAIHAVSLRKQRAAHAKSRGFSFLAGWWRHLNLILNKFRLKMLEPY